MSNLIITPEISQAAHTAFENFLRNELPQAQQYWADTEAAIYMFCHLAPAGEASRRVLVVTDKNSPIVRVCIEAACELFEGDIRHYVQRVGTVNREEAPAKLEALVREAYHRLMAWRPTYENILDTVV